MNLNIDKCKVLTISKQKNLIDFKYGFQTEHLQFVELERVYGMNDLGVVVDSELSFKEHIYGKINKANQMIGIIKRNFKNIDKLSFTLIYKSMVRSHLEFANSVWSPYKNYLIEDLEKVQKRATKLVKGLSKM